MVDFSYPEKTRVLLGTIRSELSLKVANAMKAALVQARNRSIAPNTRRKSTDKDTIYLELVT